MTLSRRPTIERHSTAHRHPKPPAPSTESSPKHAYKQSRLFQSTWLLSLHGIPHFLFFPLLLDSGSTTNSRWLLSTKSTILLALLCPIGLLIRREAAAKRLAVVRNGSVGFVFHLARTPLHSFKVFPFSTT